MPAMKKKSKQKNVDHMESLEEFYLRKKEEQEALRKLLKALDEKSERDKNNTSN